MSIVYADVDYAAAEGSPGRTLFVLVIIVARLSLMSTSVHLRVSAEIASFPRSADCSGVMACVGQGPADALLHALIECHADDEQTPRLFHPFSPLGCQTRVNFLISFSISMLKFQVFQRSIRFA